MQGELLVLATLLQVKHEDLVDGGRVFRWLLHGGQHSVELFHGVVVDLRHGFRVREEEVGVSCRGKCQ